ncbi:MAG: hypothetical protein KAX49_19115 [Halanaerobiales bacterium]|nr:hypothetical protein [Halanaerobiales bacterium]
MEEKIFIDDNWDEEQFVFKNEDLLNLFWGKRATPGKYSKLMIDWFFEKLQETREVNPIKVLDILKMAIDYQIEKGIEENQDRLISLESLEYAFKDN